MAHYTLQFIYDQSDTHIAQSIKAQVLGDLKDLQIKESVLEIIINSEFENGSSEEKIDVCVYVGSIEAKEKYTTQVNLVAEKKIPVIPVIKNDDKERFDQVTPEVLHPINAFFWKDAFSAQSISMILLRYLGLTEKQRRIFISYRQEDSSIMAEQLWDILGKNGFEVFLDRFSVEPGLDFQKKLEIALCEKAFLLLIESPNINRSKWVPFEIDYAIKTKMGFMALTWSKQASNVSEEHRFHLATEDFLVIDGKGQFKDTFLKKIPDIIEIKHAEGMLRRRRLLLGSLQAELERYKIKYLTLSDWSLVAETSSINTQGDHIFSVTPRPPEVPDLFILDQHCTSYLKAPLGKGVLIHANSPDELRQVYLQWAIATRALEMVKEDELVDKLRKFIFKK